MILIFPNCSTKSKQKTRMKMHVRRRMKGDESLTCEAV